MRGLCLVLSLFAVGCGGCGQHEDGRVSEDHAAPPPHATLGTVVGHVTLVAGAELPYYPEYMIPLPPGNADPPADCPPPRLTDHQPVRMDVQNRGLVGVMVAATEFDTTRTPHVEPVPRDVEIRDCHMTPQFVVANVGDTVRITNHSHYPYFPSVTGYGGMVQSLLENAPPREVTLDHPGITQAGCGAFGIRCGRTDVVVLSNPVWTVTQASGSYRIENVPPGVHVEIHAWHPLFEEASQAIDVRAGETKTVDLVLRVAPLPPPPPPPAPHDPNQIGDIH